MENIKPHKVNFVQRCQSRKIELVAEGRPLIDLSMINPDLSPPKLMIDKLLESTARAQNHRYSVARGLKKLRGAFVGKYRQRWGIELDPEHQCCITSGSKEAVLLLLRWCIPAKSKVLLPSPVYPAHLSAAELGGHSICYFQLGQSEAETLDSITKAVTREKPAVLILNFPNNPTGQIVSRDFYSRLAAIVERAGTLVYNDFVYGELCFGTEGVSLLSEPYFQEKGLESYSISKAYSAPGWRVAAMSGAPVWVRQLGELKTRTDYGLFIPLQVAAAQGLEGSSTITRRVAEEYELRAQGLVKDLRGLGFTISAPQAGCAVWCRHNNFATEELLTELLERYGILLSSGLSFGPEYSEMIRIALVHPPATLSNVVQVIKEIIRKR